MNITIRPALVPQDYAAIARVLTAEMPDWPTTAEDLAYEDAVRDPKLHHAVFVAEIETRDNERLSQYSHDGAQQETRLPARGSNYSLCQEVGQVMTISLISPETLQQWMSSDDERNITLIDARPYADYERGHIPGAIWIGWEDWCEPAPSYARTELHQPGYWGVLKEDAPDVLAKRFEHAGLSSDEPIVVYADGPRSKGREGRVGWMLLYYGASSVSLLDGGWSGWLRARGAEERSAPAPERGHFSVHIQPQRRALLSQLKQAYAIRKMPLLIDTRSHAEYIGRCYDYQPRKGRLPAALHLPYTDFFDDAGNFIDRDHYLHRLPAAVRQAEYIVACCEVGVRSALFALLHEYYTGHIVANFDGSVMQWALDETLPMES